MIQDNIIETDVLIIGGGLAGIFAAIKARDEGVDVAVVEKNHVGRAGAAVFATNTSFFCPDWGHNLNEWMAQVAETGDYMNNPAWTEITLKESYDRYQDLISWGVKFARNKDGSLVLFPPQRKGVLEAYRVEWREILPILRNVVLRSGAKIMDRIMVTDLLKQEGAVVGAVGFHTVSGDFYIFKAKATVICTGTGTLGVAGDTVGLNTYDGEAAAYRAGAEMSGKEFTISGTGAYSYAGSGFGLHGDKEEGDVRVSLEGREVKPISPDSWSHLYMNIDKHFDSEGYKLNRNTLAAAMHLGHGPILWDLDAATEEEISNMLKYGETVVDVRKGGLYQVPIRFECYIGWAVHCASGIASADTNGGTSLPGLFSAGDVYCSRATGAKYPHGGFGTRNAMVIGSRAGHGAAEYAKKSPKITIDPDQFVRQKTSTYLPLERKTGFDQDWISLQVKTITYPYYVWFVRHGDRLNAALTMVEFVKNHLTSRIYAKPRDTHGLRLAHETQGKVLITEMMLRAAIFRTESRGAHYREDYPFRDDPNWLAVVKIKDREGQMELVKEPIPQKWWPDLLKPYHERYPLEFLGEESIRRRK